MQTTWQGLCALALLWPGAAPAAQTKPAITLLMYLVNRPDSIASFRAHADKVSIIAPQTFSMDAQGFIAGEVPPEVLRIAKENGVAVMPLVTNRGFNQPLMHTVLDSQEARARAIRYLIYYALRDGFAGFQFDYENIHYTYRDKFTVFFREAAREFHKHRLQISAAIVGRLDDTRNSNSPGGYDNWSGVYDYAAMGKVADFISVMAYAEHGATDDPGPVAGMPWVKRISEYSASVIPARKISLGVPFYGMRWEAADPGAARKWRGRSARYPDISAALAKAEPVWDEVENSPHLSFDNNARQTELWFENARSLDLKLQLAHAIGFQGISAWVIGQEDPAFWDSLDGWRIRHPRESLADGALDARSKRAARSLGAGTGR
ncbi:MAG TPA: glycosyl hydrolase family 18 protein [Candidatus Sulfopaludibacter sp.]|nr:glycosyl hydrolase family 18 protein [Candidatus Sulfopaludibacter sp.]